jgi:hypothetical protein
LGLGPISHTLAIAHRVVSRGYLVGSWPPAATPSSAPAAAVAAASRWAAVAANVTACVR